MRKQYTLTALLLFVISCSVVAKSAKEELVVKAWERAQKKISWEEQQTITIEKLSIWQKIGTFAYNMVRPSSYLNAYRGMMRQSTWRESFSVLSSHHKPVIAGIATVLTGTALGGAYAWYKYKNKRKSKEEDTKK